MRRLHIVIAMLMLLSLVSRNSWAETAPRIGLVLSGGGAKGAAHIGAIQALEENGIPIDYVAGTSMGAIVSGLYAAGYSPQEMLEIVASKDLEYWSSGIIDKDLIYFYDRPEETAAIAHFNFNLDTKAEKKFSGGILPNNFISPLPMNYAFLELFAPYTAQCGGDFDKLFVPFRCVASDIYNRKEIVFRDGQLGDAIRASMSIPLVFKPLKKDGRYIFDGGIFNNYPVSVMQEDFAPDHMIGVDVATSSVADPDGMVGQITSLVMMPQNDSIATDKGINIRLDLSKYEMLEFSKVKEIYAIGYKSTLALIDSIKAGLPAGWQERTKEEVADRRRQFRSYTPQLVFDSDITVTGGEPYQNQSIEHLFKDTDHDGIIPADDAKRAYYRTISGDKVKDLLPHAVYDHDTKRFKLNMDLTSGDNLRFGIGGYLSSSTNSTLFFSAGYRRLSQHSFSSTLSAWIGQTNLAGELNFSYELNTPKPSRLILQGMLQRNKYYDSDLLFFQDATPQFILRYDNFVRLKVQVALGMKAKMEGAVGFGYMRDRFYPDNYLIEYSSFKQDDARYKLTQAYLSFTGNTLDHRNYPTSGYQWKIKVMGLFGKYNFRSEFMTKLAHDDKSLVWGQLDILGIRYIPFSKKVSLGLYGEMVASTKGLLSTFSSTIVNAPAFKPTGSTQNCFNPAFRANSYVAVGLRPVWKIVGSLQLGLDAYLFLPFRRIEAEYELLDTGESGATGKAIWGKWFSNPQGFMELRAAYTFPFIAVSAYVNYMTSPARNWNFGINLGIFLPSQRFLK